VAGRRDGRDGTAGREGGETTGPVRRRTDGPGTSSVPGPEATGQRVDAAEAMAEAKVETSV
jgi:hypothetical protein